jgi:hypothetical protein
VLSYAARMSHSLVALYNTSKHDTACRVRAPIRTKIQHAEGDEGDHGADHEYVYVYDEVKEHPRPLAFKSIVPKFFLGSESIQMSHRHVRRDWAPNLAPHLPSKSYPCVLILDSSCPVSCPLLSPLRQFRSIILTLPRRPLCNTMSVTL